jgi:TRAP-type mannitol/chloroaromatic compound transport system permease small subunit
MVAMRQIAYGLERLEWIGNVITRPLRWLVLLMVITTVTVVLMRYALQTSAIFLQESVMYLHGLFFMLALAFGVAQDSHVRVDILYSRMSTKRRNLVNLFGPLRIPYACRGTHFCNQLALCQRQLACA